MTIKEIKSYLEKQNPNDNLFVFLNEKKFEINSINLDFTEEVSLLKNSSTKHTKIKDLIIQLEAMYENKSIGVKFLLQDKTMKDYILIIKDDKLTLEKVKVNFETINYYFYELEEDNDMDYEEELTFNLGKALESYFNIEEVSYSDRFISVLGLSIGIYKNMIEIEGFKKYSIYSENVTSELLIKLKEDILKYIETKDFTIFEKRN